VTLNVELRDDEEKTGSYSYLARIMNTVTLFMNIFLSDAGFIQQAKYGMHILVAASQEYVNT